MHQFFTPIQLTHLPSPTTDPYPIDQFDYDPFQTLSPKIQSLADHRRKIIKWLKSMPIQSRISKLTYTNKEFSALLIKMFEMKGARLSWNNSQYEFSIANHHEQGYFLKEQRIVNIVDQTIMAAEKKITEEIVIMNCFTRFDSITVSEALASDIDKMFQLFGIVQNGVSHELTQSTYKVYGNSDSSLLFYHPSQDLGCTKSLCSWFVEIIKKTVSMKYFQEIESNGSIHRDFQEQYVKDFQEKSKRFKRFWKNLGLHQKQKIVNRIFSLDICFLVNQYRQNIKVADQSFPKIKFSQRSSIQQFKAQIINVEISNNDTSKTSNTKNISDKNNSNKNTSNANSNNTNPRSNHPIFEKLAYTELSQSIEELASYKHELMMEIESLIEREQKEMSMRKKTKKTDQPKNKMSEKSAKIQSDQITGVKQSKVAIEIFTKADSKISFSCNSPNKELKRKPINCQKNLKKKSKVNFSYRNKKQETQQDFLFSNKPEDEEGQQMTETTNDFDSRSQDDQKQESQERIVNKIEASKCENEFNKLHNELIQKSNSSKKLKKLAINRIRNILEAYHISFKIFGSYIYGISLPNSDIDFCIGPTIIHYFYHSFCTYRQKIAMALNFLKEIFQQHPWAKSMKLITTASVPLLTFDVDLKVCVPQPKFGFFNPTKNGQDASEYIISIDLTIQPFSDMIEEVPQHFGYQSTNMIKDWVNQYDKLSSITLILKNLLSKYHLNKPFTGGISSFSLIIWIVGFLEGEKRKQEIQQSNIRDLIIKFCRFGSALGDKTCLVNLKSQNPIVLLPANHQYTFSNRLVIVSPLNSKNLTENCYKLQEIEDLFQKIANIVENTPKKNPKVYKKSLRSLFFE